MVAIQPLSTRLMKQNFYYENRWAARIFEEWVKVRFLQVATLESAGVIKN